jgi:hypothetical protein
METTAMNGLNGRADPVIDRHLLGLSQRVRQMAVADRAERSHVVCFIEAAGSGRVRVCIALDVWRVVHEMQPHCPYPIRVIGTVPNRAFNISLVQAQFAEGRLHGEWFVMSDAIRDFIAKNGSTP